MPPLEGAELELDANVDGTDQVTGAFRFGAEARVNSRTVTDYVADRRGSALNAIVGSAAGSYGDDRTAYYVDLGAGGQIWEIDKMGWTGSSEQWGDGSGNYQRDATGSNAWHQAQMLQRYHSRGEYDSRGAQARLRVGEISDEGAFDAYVPVTIRECEFNRVADEPMTFDVNITLARAAQLNEPIDISKQVVF